MGYVKVTAPKKAVTEVKVNRTNFIISPAGLETISKIAPALADATLVNLWWDALTGKAAITPADSGDSDAAVIEKGTDGARIAAKVLFEYASLRAGSKLASEQLEPSENGGVAVTFAGLSLPHPSTAAAGGPKKRGRKPKIAV